MHHKDFDNGISIITQVFGENPIKGPRLARIKEFVDGEVSGQGFIEICNTISDTFRNAPLPIDFHKAALEWRRNYFLENGSHYGDSKYSNVTEATFVEINCDKCNDIGYVRIRHRVPDDFDSLMLCGCPSSPPDPIIPEWDAQLSGVFSKTAVPVEWFKPKVTENDSYIELHEKIWSKVEGWSKWRKKAERHWAQLRGLE